jgi:hypothetical protein
MLWSYTSQGLERWTSSSFPEKVKSQFEIEKYIKPWRLCRSCGSPAKYCCIRCGDLGSKDKTRYCVCTTLERFSLDVNRRIQSRACQEKDWKLHAPHCKASIMRENGICRTTSIEGVDFRLVQIRQLERWMMALDFPRVSLLNLLVTTLLNSIAEMGRETSLFCTAK